MAKPELWAFILANIGLFIASSVLTVLSYLAYRRNDQQSSYKLSSIGFGLIVLGGLVEPLYQLIVRGDYNLSGGELLLLQSGEGLLIASGLGILFYAITRHTRASSEDNGEQTAATEDFTYTIETTENKN